MPFTREFIRKAAKESGVELPKELEDALVQEHLSARDAYASDQVKTALDGNKQTPPPAVKDTQEYKSLEKEFDDYKQSVAEKETKAAKEAAARSYYESKNITGKALGLAMRGSAAEIDSLELDENGKIKSTKPLDALIAGDFSGLVSQTQTHGANTANPPANNGGSVTREDIYKKNDKGRYLMDATERQAALAKMMSEEQK